MESNKILIASNGKSTILILNGKECVAESISFKAGIDGTTLDISGLDVSREGDGFVDFCDYLEGSMGYDVFIKDPSLQKPVITSRKT